MSDLTVPLAAVLTVLWGGLASADAAAFLQLLLGQPLVAGAVTGALWGRPEIGLELGSILQLFACGTLPLGGRTPEDFPAGTVAGVGVACALARALPLASAHGGPLLYGLGVAFAVALVGRPLTVELRRKNESLARWCEDELVRGRLSALSAAQWAGVARTFALGAALVGVSLGLAALAGRALLAGQAVVFGRAWQVGSPWFWGFGAGIVTRGFVRGRRPGVFFWLALVAFLALRLVSVR